MLYDFKQDGAIKPGETLVAYEDGSIERITVAELAPLPLAQDLPALIRQEHQVAELLRLRASYDGCGCALCQEVYTTLDLAKYGDRAKQHGFGRWAVTLIQAGRTGADLWDEYHVPDYWRNDVFLTGGKAYGLTPGLQTLVLGNEKEILENQKGEKHGETGNDIRPTGKYRVSKARLQRAKPAGNAGHKLRYVKSSQAKQRFPGGLPGHTQPMLLDPGSTGVAGKKPRRR
jgi:hypothetical protein